MSAEVAHSLLREARNASLGGAPLAKCRKCGKHTCVIGRKCQKCGAYFQPPERSESTSPDSWRDECPKCGFSADRDEAVRAALKLKKEGAYDRSKMPQYIRRAVEKAEASGQYDE